MVTERRLSKVPMVFLLNTYETGMNEHANTIRKCVVVHNDFQ